MLSLLELAVQLTRPRRTSFSQQLKRLRHEVEQCKCKCSLPLQGSGLRRRGSAALQPVPRLSEWSVASICLFIQDYDEGLLLTLLQLNSPGSSLHCHWPVPRSLPSTYDLRCGLPMGETAYRPEEKAGRLYCTLAEAATKLAGSGSKQGVLRAIGAQ